MKPKKACIDSLKESGEDQKLNKLFSAIFLLMNLSKTYMEDAGEILLKHGLLIGEVKRDLNAVYKYYEQFIKPIRETIDAGSKDNQVNFFDDFDKLEQIVKDFLKIEE